ncbi:sugar phosphate isomerase/epimerase family protein [Aeromicrobium sp. CF4.19]|uniref:sugar phosphate isomerase/epimerase family protein n=1 Tax=Aeromicrobium sp. CF4.19 TaxID=3373082 RepID=UPI003EE439FA
MSTSRRPGLSLHPAVAMSGWDAELAVGVLDRAAELGYQHVIVPLRRPQDVDVPTTARWFAERGLTPITSGNQVHGADVSCDDPDVRAAGLARLRYMIEMTTDLGGDQMQGVLYGVLGKPAGRVAPERFRRTAELLGELADSVPAGVTVACEIVNRYETAMMNTAADGLRFLEASGSDRLALHLDTFHMNIEETDPTEAVQAALPRLAYLEIGQSHRGELSHGTAPVEQVLDAALAAGYRGRVGVEAFSAAVLDEEVAGGLAIWRDVFGADNRIAEQASALLKAACDRAGID